jgi:hypothetical protein
MQATPRGFVAPAAAVSKKSTMTGTVTAAMAGVPTNKAAVIRATNKIIRADAGIMGN